MTENQNNLPSVPLGMSAIAKSAEEFAKIFQTSGLDLVSQEIARCGQMVEEMNRQALSDLSTMTKAIAGSFEQLSALVHSPLVETLKQIQEQHAAMLKGLMEAQASWLTKLAEIAQEVDYPPINIRTHGPDIPVLSASHAFRHIRQVVKLTDVEKVNRHLSQGWTVISIHAEGPTTVFILGWQGAEDPPEDDAAAGEWVPPIGRA